MWTPALRSWKQTNKPAAPPPRDAISRLAAANSGHSWWWLRTRCTRFALQFLAVALNLPVTSAASSAHSAVNCSSSESTGPAFAGSDGLRPRWRQPVIYHDRRGRVGWGVGSSVAAGSAAAAGGACRVAREAVADRSHQVPRGGNCHPELYCLGHDCMLGISVILYPTRQGGPGPPGRLRPVGGRPPGIVPVPGPFLRA